ncbi:unnamed protein product [Mycena citricolor]|uniref:Uncharacterized protein n=1 Tax=Mycena citricolor TaxID=2018698 RepID=A0AAD2Q3L4_9AGAR|nr:unnamed protein product [Mycena citricolor]
MPVRTRAKASSPDVKLAPLPTEVQREIMRLAGVIEPGCMPKMMLASKKVRDWYVSPTLADTPHRFISTRGSNLGSTVCFESTLFPPKAYYFKSFWMGKSATRQRQPSARGRHFACTPYR